MQKFDDSRFYRTNDDALSIIATQGTLAQWRHRGYGPAYVRFGNRVLYRGCDLNAWLDKHVIKPGEAA